jgi:hypothetical protein
MKKLNPLATLLTLLMFAGLLIGPAEAATVVSVSNGDWSDPSTWSSNTVPGPGDDITVNHTIDKSNNLTIDNTLTVAQPGTLNVSNKIQNDGTIRNEGIINANAFANGGGGGGGGNGNGNGGGGGGQGASGNDGTITGDGYWNLRKIVNRGDIQSGTFNSCDPANSGCNCDNPINNTDQGDVGDDVTTCESPQPLPVTLSALAGHFDAAQAAVQLRWRTAREVNNSHFVVQYSPGGDNFQAIGRVAGAGNTQRPQAYHFRAQAPGSASEHAYYRLKQVDFDGTAHYSSTIEVALAEEDQRPARLFAGFDAEQQALTLTPSQLQGSGRVHLRVMDVQGRTVFQRTYTEAQVPQQQQVGSSLDGGIYILQWQQGAEGSTRRFQVLQ